MALLSTLSDKEIVEKVKEFMERMDALPPMEHIAGFSEIREEHAKRYTVEDFELALALASGSNRSVAMMLRNIGRPHWDCSSFIVNSLEPGGLRDIYINLLDNYEAWRPDVLCYSILRSLDLAFEQLFGEELAHHLYNRGGLVKHHHRRSEQSAKEAFRGYREMQDEIKAKYAEIQKKGVRHNA
jgi:hypothetical protein